MTNPVPHSWSCLLLKGSCHFFFFGQFSWPATGAGSEPDNSWTLQVSQAYQKNHRHAGKEQRQDRSIKEAAEVEAGITAQMGSTHCWAGQRHGCTESHQKKKTSTTSEAGTTGLIQF